MSSKHRLSVAISFAIALGGAGLLGAPGAHAQAPSPAGVPDATDLDTIVVRPQLESQARAIEDKRSSDAIQDGVSADTIGQFPDKNVSEALQRVPGISVTRDQGEGRFVVVRGLDAGLNSVSVDGMDIGTPEDSVRSATLDVIPSDSTERLTVIKAPTPDMPGDSIGGRIEIESASGFDRDGRDLRAKLEAGYNQLSGDTSPKAALNFSDVSGDGRLGIALGLNYQDREFQSDNTEFEYDEGVDGVPDGELFAIAADQRKYFVNRERLGANANLDWRPSAGNRYYLRTLYSDFTDAETRQRSVIGFGDGEVTGAAGGVYTVEDMPADAFGRRVRFRTKEQSTLAVSAGGENVRGDLTMDYRVGYTDTRERVGDEVEARFEYDADGPLSAVVDQRGALPVFTIDDPAGDGWLRNDGYAFDRLVFGPQAIDDQEVSGAFNVRLQRDSVTWKTGLVGRWRERDVDVDEFELRRGPDPGLGSLSAGAPDYRFGQLGDGISSSALRRFLAQRGGEFSERPQDVAENTEVSTTGDYAADETILAGYAMATMDFEALRVIAGVRVERTDFDVVGNAVEVDEDAGTLEVTRRDAGNRYTNVLPGVHLRYDGFDDWVLRGAWTNTISRPSFGDASPRVSINRGEQEASVGNPDLEPYESSNLDASVERYIGDTGIASAGVFYKRIDGYIVETVGDGDPQFPDDPGFEVTRPVNGDRATVLGIELNWQQALTGLPGALSGLLVGASATWLDTEFTVALPDRAGQTFSLPRASDQVYSAFLGYETGAVSTRLALTRRGEYLDAIGGSPAFDIYVADNSQLDFSLDYRVNAQWGVFFEASNLLDEPLELYQGTSSNVLQQEFYERTYTIGLKARL